MLRESRELSSFTPEDRARIERVIDIVFDDETIVDIESTRPLWSAIRKLLAERDALAAELERRTAHPPCDSRIARSSRMAAWRRSK